MAEEKGKVAGAGVPPTVCPSCKAPNELGALTCKKCGDILSKKPKSGKKGQAEEFDATEGSFHSACIIVPIVLLVGAILLLFLTTRGCKGSTPCDHNRDVIGRAIMKYEKAHPEDKLAVLDYTKLSKPDSKGKPYLKEKPVCPFDSGAEYEYDGQKITCSKCSKKK